MLFGVIGIFRFKDFYSRILISSKVETVGFITLMAGVVIKYGFTYFSLKILLICLVVVITNPLSTHAIARSALISGFKIKEEK
ncbi:cation:proton antiporter [Alkalibaculum sp. M08DMB]|uniref:Cation:proton antiporter n=2 Tax=Alkalibaculum sporogenes TaxID=2655001 RepID=A0A6A7K8D8_9FIRM|nr:cation:proton antiporter [Alkalibaculum sporogenes]